MTVTDLTVILAASFQMMCVMTHDRLGISSSTLKAWPATIVAPSMIGSGGPGQPKRAPWFTRERQRGKVQAPQHWLLPDTSSGVEEWCLGGLSCSREEQGTQLRLQERLKVNAFATADLLECRGMTYRGTRTILSDRRQTRKGPGSQMHES